MDGDDVTLDPAVEREFVEPAGDAFRDLVRVMAKLRGPDGCPWDAKQTHHSLARHLLEETHEVLEAIDDGDLASLREELGDLVLQVVFHSEIAYEEGAFTVADVLDELRAKLISRHPHVFGDLQVSGADEVLSNWEKMKRDTKRDTGRQGVMDGIPKTLPALARAAKVFRRGRQVGFRRDEDVADTLAKLDEEIAELRDELEGPEPDTSRVEAELGDVLFIVAALGGYHGIDPEDALRRMLARAEGRFATVERLAGDRDLESLSPEEWRGYWDRAKKEFP